MGSYNSLFFFLLILIGASCQSTINEDDDMLTEAYFTPISEIDPQIYFANAENISNDPNKELTQMFTQKKAADLANPNKPRPFNEKDINQIENISHKQPWTPVDQIFKFDWKEIGEQSLSDLSKVIKTRIVFDNLDLKVVELAIAPGGILPLHAQATPSVYHILGGEGEVLANDTIAQVYTGTSIKFDSYTQKRVKVTSAEPLKILWFSWAPQGDKSYLESGYYLTGSNIHVQPIESVLPEDFDFWNKEDSKSFKIIDTPEDIKSSNSAFVTRQRSIWGNLDKTPYYSDSPNLKSASDVDWVNVVDLDPKSFFFAKDISKLGDALKMLSRIAKIKSVFRVKRPEGGYDLNYSYLAWGPQSKYVTHSHAICEFYYLLDGDVEYIINNQTYHAVPGNFYFHPPYYDHEMRGLKANVPFLSISGSWIPYGQRELFDRPYLLLEDIQKQRDISLPDDFIFHDFKIRKDMKFGVI